MKRLWLCFKFCFCDIRGSINAHMGMDLFVMLLMVFIILTAILLKTFPDNTASASNPEEEMRTPNITISLPKDGNGGLPVGKGGAVKVSAGLKADGNVDFFVDSKKTPLYGISGILKEKEGKRVELRLDENLTNAITVKILGQLRQASVKEIYYVFVQNRIQKMCCMQSVK